MTTYHHRAARIVDRAMPSIETPHGFYDPQGFMDALCYAGERKRLYWRTFARLRAKAEGGKPYISPPKDCGHIWGPGDAMFDVAHELASGD